jgi:hypothetical protein
LPYFSKGPRRGDDHGGFPDHLAELVLFRRELRLFGGEHVVVPAGGETLLEEERRHGRLQIRDQDGREGVFGDAEASRDRRQHRSGLLPRTWRIPPT